jgi:putative flippase GtrA
MRQQDISISWFQQGWDRLLQWFPILQVMKYGLVGGLAAGVQFAVVFALVQTMAINPLAANFVGFFAGFLVSFSGHRLWTFRGAEGRVQAILTKFFLLALLNLALNQGVFSVLLLECHWHYTWALFAAIAVATVIVFTLNKFWVFKD